MPDDIKKTISKYRNTPSAFEHLMEDCERPACDDVKAMFIKAKARLTESQKNDEIEQKATVECPPSSGALGTATWTLLHSMAAWYPDDPNERDREQMFNFFDAFARFYPCPWCAKDFRTNLQKKPVRTTSRKELCQWLCEQHNIVNQKIGKPAFPCDMETLDERWRKSSKEECQSSGH